MSEIKDSWAEYSRLVLKELERLNSNHEKMREDFDYRLNEMNLKLNDFKNIEKSMNQNNVWIQKVSDVWSPAQMKEAKDEIYKQKNRWVAAIAILSFIQILIAIFLSIWGKF